MTKHSVGSDIPDLLRAGSPEFRAVDRPLERASTLPGRMFSDQDVYAAEMDRLFQRCLALRRTRR